MHSTSTANKFIQLATELVLDVGHLNIFPILTITIDLKY